MRRIWQWLCRRARSMGAGQGPESSRSSGGHELQPEGWDELHRAATTGHLAAARPLVEELDADCQDKADRRSGSARPVDPSKRENKGEAAPGQAKGVSASSAPRGAAAAAARRRAPALRRAVLPALRRAGARRLAAAAAAPRGALDADTPLAWPGAASPLFSRLLGSTGRALPLRLRLRLQRQRAEPVVGTAHGKEKGLLLPALSPLAHCIQGHRVAQGHVSKAPTSLHALGTPVLLLPARLAGVGDRRARQSRLSPARLPASTTG
ncbi:unnamed protein product, partial [Bubo scandiacus]